MPATPSGPTPAELHALQALLDRSTRTATPAVAYPARQLSAAEFVAPSVGRTSPPPPRRLHHLAG